MTNESKALFPGYDNYDKPRLNYCARLEKMSDDQLFAETKDTIWLSAYSSNNPKSDYHWQVTACYHEWQCRAKLPEYQRAFDQAKG